MKKSVFLFLFLVIALSIPASVVAQEPAGVSGSSVVRPKFRPSPPAEMSTLLAADPPGVGSRGVTLTDVTVQSVGPEVTESGFVSLSVDGLGTNDAGGGIIQVEKPAGATVRSAFMAAASTGLSNRMLNNGDVSIDGQPVNWSVSTPSSISSWNHWADVTSIVQTKIDAAPAGRVDFSITEVSTTGIDGEILAVIFDDPNQTTSNTIILLFGAQDVAGDSFNIALAEPIDTSDPNLVLDFSLGISFSSQPSLQDSQVDVNGVRLTSSAGGQDDGSTNNGALLTVGGLDDSNANPPDPFARGNQPTCPRCDDEQYNLIPFVNDGDTAINVFTLNPSGDDNIFFAALFLTGEAIVGEGILLSPADATNIINTEHTVTALVQDDDGNPVVGREVIFTIIAGPHAGQTGTGITDANGEATFTYTGTALGTDTIVATFVDSQGQTQTSNEVTKTWEPEPNQPPVADANGDNGEYFGDEGSAISLDGTGSSDPDGDPLEFSWSVDSALCSFDNALSATPNLTCTDNGNFTVTLTVDDGQATDSDTASVTVANVPPTADAGPDQTVFRNETVNVTGTWTDPAGSADDPYAWEWDLDGDGTTDSSGSASFGDTIMGTTSFALPGFFTLSFQVTDKDGGTGSDTVVIEAVNQPPDCSEAGPSVETLWAPNHQFVEIEVLGVSDPDGDPIVITIDSIFQDESVDHLGDGRHTPDGRGVGTSKAEVRAERAGVGRDEIGNGRFYHISYTADDGFDGGTCSGEVRVGVPHDQGKNHVLVDDGPLFDSTVEP